MQTEYRQVNSKSDHVTILVFLLIIMDYLFYAYNKILNYRNFNESEFNFKLQQTSNETYIEKQDKF